MTNKTTASQPKSIGDDAQFRKLADAYRCALPGHVHGPYTILTSFIDNYRAPAAQASAFLSLADDNGFRLALNKYNVGELSEKDFIEFLDGHAKQAAQASATIQAAPIGMHAAADLIDAKAQKYLDDHADTENDTGAVVFHYGEAGRDYHSTLVELAEELRLAATIQEPVMVAEPVAEVVEGATVGMGIPTRDIKFIGASAKVGDKLYLAAPMVADPAGVVTWQDRIQAAHPRSEAAYWPDDLKVKYMGYEIDAYRKAATVKAVPSEALDEPAERESLIACLEDDAAKLADANPDDEMVQTMKEAAEMLRSDGGINQLVESLRRGKIAAPLADMTGGGE